MQYRGSCLRRERTSAVDYFISLRSPFSSWTKRLKTAMGRIISPGKKKENKKRRWIFAVRTPYDSRGSPVFLFPNKERVLVFYIARGTVLRTAAIWLACKCEPKKAEGRAERWRYISLSSSFLFPFLSCSTSLFVSIYLSLSDRHKNVRYTVKDEPGYVNRHLIYIFILIYFVQ